MITDVHAHYHPRSYIEALPRVLGEPGRPVGRHPDTDDEAHIQSRMQMMQEAGVGMQVLSPAGGRAPYGKNEDASVTAARLMNDACAQVIARHPDRFKAWVTVPLPHVNASLRELKRGMDELGMVGLNLHISALDRSVAEDEFLPLYEEMNRRSGLIFFHPCTNGICSPMVVDYGPNITYIIPHLGGLMPMLLQRLDNQFSMKDHNLPEPPSVTARRFYYDTVGHGSPAALTCAWKAFGADHILPGSDYPVLLTWETYAKTFSWIREAGLPAGDVDQILERTAPSILKLT